MRISYLKHRPDLAAQLRPGVLAHWRHVFPDDAAEARRARRTAMFFPMSPYIRMQRSGHDKVHAPHRSANISISDYAPQGWRAVADAGRLGAQGVRCG
jgi:hypothetical protein